MNMVKGKGRHCDLHKGRGTTYQRDPDVQAFYQSPRWRRLRQMKLDRNPLCEVCQLKGFTTRAVMVHHTVPSRQGMEDALVMMYLVSLCHACHNQLETELEGQAHPGEEAIVGAREY